jgi:hypothetical protein
MTFRIFIAGLAATIFLSGCELNSQADKTRDFGLDSKPLSELTAGIWVDPHGCDHWIIDDGFEGYLSQRLDPYGKPVCSGAAPPGYATGPFKGGTTVEDPL